MERSGGGTRAQSIVTHTALSEKFDDCLVSSDVKDIAIQPEDHCNTTVTVVAAYIVGLAVLYFAFSLHLGTTVVRSYNQQQHSAHS